MYDYTEIQTYNLSSCLSNPAFELPPRSKPKKITKSVNQQKVLIIQCTQKCRKKRESNFIQKVSLCVYSSFTQTHLHEIDCEHIYIFK